MDAEIEQVSCECVKSAVEIEAVGQRRYGGSGALVRVHARLCHRA